MFDMVHGMGKLHNFQQCARSADIMVRKASVLRRSMGDQCRCQGVLALNWLACCLHLYCWCRSDRSWQKKS